ncbi:sodium-coupled monocarboxylate transporter 1-like [Lingula anatina]|uniref:Sodium-coupled monocarboxylate transporter 1-like n=1 Tax=Lingula anatina TaxID=7574 RepID=A0A1S3H441_LINAN|nr:sodium-coupled monocarboxylate transporter 1-like [Lingula anatina]|eukprot:XP_013380727.1 sodium-coupled monocarboxylate transporter 1-like [Lingula anatina]
MPQAQVNTFGPVDYVVFAGTLVVSASIGIYQAFTGGRQRTTTEFLMANRQMGAIPAAMSLLASFMSAITLLGTPKEMYVYGTQYLWIAFGYLLVIPVAAHIFLPIFFRLKITSAYEYLEMRFNKAVRVAGSLTFSLQMILYMAIVLYAPSLALEQVTGLNRWIAVCSVGVVCVFYTSIGGMKAVMWTDTFQVFMMVAGMLAVVIQGSLELGGFRNAWEINIKGGRINFLDFNPDPRERHTVWTCVFGGFFTWLSVYGVNQAQVQRALTVVDLKRAQIAMWINAPGLIAILIISAMSGILIYAHYFDCDPMTNKDITNQDQLLPLFVMDKLAFVPGLPGLFTACLFSGALSTLSSGLNSLATVWTRDLFQEFCCKEMPDSRATFTSKIMSVVFGCIVIGLTFVASQLGGVLQAALALFGMIGGPLLGVFTLGVLFPWANWKGAIAGLVTSLLFTFWIGIGAQIYKPAVWKAPGAITGLVTSLLLTFWIGIGAQIYKPAVWKAPVSILGCNAVNETVSNVTTAVMINVTPMPTAAPYDPPLNGLYNLSYLWYSGFGVLVVVVVGMVVSAITGFTDTTMLDYRLICPIFDVMFCCFPKSFRQALRCGVDHDTTKFHYCCVCKDVDKEDISAEAITAAELGETKDEGFDNKAMKTKELEANQTNGIMKNENDLDLKKETQI